MTSLSRDAVPLAEAAVVAYEQISGRRLAFRRVSEMNDILQRVAHALSNVVRIAAMDPATGTERCLDPIELLCGSFKQGATVLRKWDGSELRGLTISRSEMESAILILRHNGVSF